MQKEMNTTLFSSSQRNFLSAPSRVGDEPSISVPAQRVKTANQSWACIRRLDGIWSSNVSPQVKRKLFFALVVPHWTYGDIAWPRLRSSSIAMHRRCNVMLRHCLGPCAAEWHTEELSVGLCAGIGSCTAAFSPSLS